MPFARLVVVTVSEENRSCQNKEKSISPTPRLHQIKSKYWDLPWNEGTTEEDSSELLEVFNFGPNNPLKIKKQ